MPEGVVSGRLAGISAGGLVLLGFASRLRYGYEWDELQLPEADTAVGAGRPVPVLAANAEGD